MHGLAEYEVWRQRHEEIRQEVTAARLAETARANRERRPYVVRDLSWELARHLDKEVLSTGASANGPNGG